VELKIQVQLGVHYKLCEPAVMIFAQEEKELISSLTTKNEGKQQLRKSATVVCSRGWAVRACETVATRAFFGKLYEGGKIKIKKKN